MCNGSKKKIKIKIKNHDCQYMVINEMVLQSML